MEVGHRVENGWGLTKVAAVLLKWSHMVKNDIYPKTTLIKGYFEMCPKKNFPPFFPIFFTKIFLFCIFKHEGGTKPALGHP